MSDFSFERLRPYIRPVRIGRLETENNIFLAPLAGVADRAFRVICREQGAGFVCSEMISAKGVHYGSGASVELAVLDEREKPAAVQIFGSDPAIMAEAAERFEAMGAAVIDINMGCPVPKVVGNGEGAALMRDPELAGRIVSAVCRRVSVPVTVKMRRGFARDCENAPELARIAEAAGAAAVAVHGRYREEYYTGQSDRGVIRRVKEQVKIPVIASGDVRSAEDAYAVFRETGCDAIMIGRAALGNPWIFRSLTTGAPAEKDDGRFLETVLRHLDLAVAFKGESVGVREMRRHLACYLKGRRGAAAMKDRIFKAESREEIVRILREAFS